MTTFIIRRIFWTILVMFVITLTVFFIFFHTPGIDPVRQIWELRADLVLNNGATLQLHGSESSPAGDVDVLRLRSLATNAVTDVSAITAHWGTIDVDHVDITSWDDAASAPDTNHDVPAGATGVRGRSGGRPKPPEGRGCGCRGIPGCSGRLPKPPEGRSGLVYSRFNHPNLEIVEDRLAVYEKAEQGLVFSSGMAAISTTILTYLRPGEVILHSRPLYGGTEVLIEKTLNPFGIEAEGFIDGLD